MARGLTLALLLSAVSSVRAGCTLQPSKCYADAVAHRVLGDPVDDGGMTREYCAQLCADKKMALAGVEFGSQCMCGAALVGTPKASTGCTMSCGSDGKEKCGGNDAIDVFSFQCSGAPVPTPKPPPPPPPCPFNSPPGSACPSELYNPCIDDTPQAKMPFCNYSLPIEVRAADMVARMSVSEKICNLDTGGCPIKALNLPAYNWWSEASSGVASGRNTMTTKFAFPITTGMAFNRTLWQVTGNTIGREARAMMNAGNGLSTFWAPVINLAREPRWGRNIETPGEDPYLTGEYAEWYTKGMQQAPEDPYHIQASACCKHYVANSMDGTTQKDGEHHDRNHVDSEVPMQDLIDSYMYPFQACVEKGQVTSLMCSYNAVNGVPSCANDWLLDTVARKEWGFDGYITSDCDADNDVIYSHHYANHTAAQGVADVLHAGTDVDCGGFVGKNAQGALDAKTITEADIDERLVMLFKVRIRLTHFDPVGPLQKISVDDICTAEHIATSMDGVVQSATLLKNTLNTLPLSGATAGTIAVIGPNAQLSKSDAGYYGPHNVCAGNFWTVVDAMAKYGKNVSFDAGIPSVQSEDQSGIPKAVALCAAADTCVLAVGSDLSWAAEGHDAKNISFTTAQQTLITQAAAAAKKPIIVITLTAVPLDIAFFKDNAKVGAIIHVGQPSVTVLGLSEVMFKEGGKSPSGKTIQTIYPSAYQDQISIFDFKMRPGPSAFVRPDCTQHCEHAAMHGGPCGTCAMGTNPGRTYRFYTGTPVVPFGFGLSYTTFAYKLASAPTGTISLDAVRDMLATTAAAGRTFPSSHLLAAAAPLVKYEINVTNTGTMDADDAVLGKLIPPGAGTDGVALSQLYGFDKVHIKAGETVTVELYPSLADFTQVDSEGVRKVHPGDYTFQFGLQETAEFGMGYAEHTVSMA